MNLGPMLCDNNDVYLCGNTAGSLAGQNDGQWVLRWRDTNAPANVSGYTSTVRLRTVFALSDAISVLPLNHVVDNWPY